MKRERSAARLDARHADDDARLVGVRLATRVVVAGDVKIVNRRAARDERADARARPVQYTAA